MKRLLCFFIIIFFHVVGCVTVSLDTPKSRRATNVNYSEPKAPFKLIDQAPMDKAWKNTQNGNMISFLSECNSSSDPSLEQVQQNVLSDMENSRLLRSENTQYNRRFALRSEIEGRVDGVRTRVDLLIFKKSNCLFILTYTGLAEQFDENLSHFQEFLAGFEVP